LPLFNKYLRAEEKNILKLLSAIAFLVSNFSNAIDIGTTNPAPPVPATLVSHIIKKITKNPQYS